MSDFIKAVYLKDLGVYSFELKGGSYLVNEKPILVANSYKKESIQCESIDNIRKVNVSQIISRYEDAEGHILTVNDYQLKRSELEVKLLFDEDGCIVSTDLDAEFEFRKFISKWSAVNRTVEEVSEPLTIVVDTEIQIETGSDFIKPVFSLDGVRDNSLYIFYRRNHALHVLSQTLKNLGVVYDKNAKYHDTKLKKIWSDSGHDNNCKFITAFGGYLKFMEVFGNSGYERRTTLARCKEMAANDRAVIASELKAQYAAHFGKDVSINVRHLLKDFDSIEYTLGKVQSMQRTRGEYSRCVKMVKDARTRMVAELAGELRS